MLEQYLSGDTLQCLECGSHYKNLSLHLFHSHLLSREDYCLRYGLPLSTTLVGQEIREKLAENALDRFNNLAPDNKEEVRKKLRTLNHGKKLKKLRTVLCPQCLKQCSSISGKSEALCEDCLDSNRKAAIAKHEKNLGVGNHHANCPECLKSFTMSVTQFYNLSKGRTIFCSKDCSAKYYGRERTKKGFVERECQNCKKSYLQKKSRNSLFCSQECYFQVAKDLEGKFKRMH